MKKRVTEENSFHLLKKEYLKRKGIYGLNERQDH